MDQAVVGATIQVVLQTLLSASIDEIKLVFGFKRDLEILKSSLLMIQDFLHDAEVKQVNNRAVRRWLEQLEDVAFEADAVLDECNYELLRQKVKKQKPASNKVLSFLPSGSKKLLFHRKMAHKIVEVNKNLATIKKEAQSFGLQMIAMSSDHANSSVGFVLPPTDSLSIEPHIVGRDNDESKMVEMLLSAPQDKTISVFPVLGMGGLGKTTLARKVFHNLKIVSHFEKRIWVCASTTFDATILFKMILESLSRENVQFILTREVVLEKIREQLASKRFLLVLDDVWNENSNKWNDFISSISGISPIKGNCILVTTRKGNVASLMGTIPTHQPLSLSKDDCWSIIKSKVCSTIDVCSEYEEIGQCIAQRCGGLPLVAKVVGGLLCGKSKNEWQYILRDQLLKFGLDDDTVMNILKLSYDRLPSSTMKKCFAYCSIFSQDYRIKREEVVELWMAEGFLQAGRGKDMETVGDEIFNFLLQNSLFQDAEKDEYGNITKCRMHDLVHDLACSVSGSRTVTIENSSSTGLHQARYLAIKSIGDEPFSILKQQAKCLRTIFFEGKIVVMYMGFKQLHVLKIMQSVNKLPDAIAELIQLRLFDISMTSISNLPDSIGKLYNLQTLYLPRFLISLPKTIVGLISLRHLYIYGTYLIGLPPWMGKLTCLQTLPYFKVGNDQGCGIGEIGKLNNLKGFMKIQNLEKVKDKKEAKKADLIGKSKIFGLVLEWKESREVEVNDESVLDGLQPHPSLKSLKIIWYKSKTFPSWTMNMAVHDEIKGHGEVLHNLIEIKLENCKGCEEVPMFGHLPHLRLLELKSLSNVKSMGLSFYGFENGGISGMSGNVNCREAMRVFPALEKLELSGMGELSEWAEVEGAVIVFPCLKYLRIKACPKLKSFPSHLPCLEELDIRKCPKLKSFPSHFPCLEDLQVQDVDSDFSLAEVCHNTSYLQSIEIISLPGLTCLPEELLVKNQNLGNLHISCCPEIESIPCVKGLSSLRQLHIWGCDKLKVIPLDLNSLGSLEELRIVNCQELKSIIPYARDSQQQCIFINTSLKKLGISECPGLIDLPIELFQSNCSSSLQEWSLVRIPKLMNIPSRKISGRLRSLRIGGFSVESISLDSLKQHLKCNLQESHSSLEELYLYGKEDWDTLPDEIQHLTALRILDLNDFGRIEALPEWIRNLSSLNKLWISNCKRLRHLPSKEAMLSLAKLDRLRIEDCPLLAKRCTKNTGSSVAAITNASSEWDKISHIKHVYIFCKSVSLLYMGSFINYIAYEIKEICYRLRWLLIGGFSDSVSLDSFNQHLNRLPQKSHGSLKELYLYGKEDWESLPDQIQHLTSLQHLHLHAFGRIEALPEWIRNSSSLQNLSIENCTHYMHYGLTVSIACGEVQRS